MGLILQFQGTLTKRTQLMKHSVLLPSSSNIIEMPSKNIDLPMLTNNHILKFIAKLHNYSNLPRSQVMLILKDITNLFEKEVQDIILLLQSNKLELLDCNILEKLGGKNKPFMGLDSEYLQFRAFSENDTFIPPEQIPLGE